MKRTLIEGGVWVVAGLVLWLAPPSWKPLAYVLFGLAFAVAVSGYLASRRRVRESKAAVDTAKRKVDELRKNMR